VTKKVIIEAKNLKEAEEIAQKELGVEIKYIKLEPIKERKGILGIGASTTYEASLDINLPFEGKKYLEEIFHNLGIDVNTEFRQKLDGDTINYQIQSDENALLIGVDGRTLNALQTVLRSYLNKLTDKKIRVYLDVGGYKENKRKQLEILATKTAKEVAFSGEEQALEPMNSYKRRIIHTKLADWRDVYTISEGEEPDRYIVIKPKKNRE